VCCVSGGKCAGECVLRAREWPLFSKGAPFVWKDAGVLLRLSFVLSTSLFQGGCQRLHCGAVVCSAQASLATEDMYYMYCMLNAA